MIIGKMSIVQNFHGYSDTVIVVVAVGEVDGVADIGEKNKLISGDPGFETSRFLSMLQRALWLSVSADDQIQLIMNRGWKSRTLIVALLQWLDCKTLKLLLFNQLKQTLLYKNERNEREILQWRLLKRTILNRI